MNSPTLNLPIVPIALTPEQSDAHLALTVMPCVLPNFRQLHGYAVLLWRHANGLWRREAAFGWHQSRGSAMETLRHCSKELRVPHAMLDTMESPEIPSFVSFATRKRRKIPLQPAAPPLNTDELRCRECMKARAAWLAPDLSNSKQAADPGRFVLWYPVCEMCLYAWRVTSDPTTHNLPIVPMPAPGEHQPVPSPAPAPDVTLTDEQLFTLP